MQILESQHIQVDKEWVKTGRTRLLASHKRMILNGEELDDVVLKFGQKLLKNQFPNTGGLQNPVLQGKKKRINAKGLQCLQVIYSRQNHWILASTAGKKGLNKVVMYDSLYDNIDDRTQTII